MVFIHVKSGNEPRITLGNYEILCGHKNLHPQQLCHAHRHAGDYFGDTHWSTVSVALIPGVSARIASTEVPVRRCKVWDATVVMGSFRMFPPSTE